MNLRTIVIWGIAIIVLLAGLGYLYIQSKVAPSTIPEGVSTEVDINPAETVVTDIPKNDLPQMPSLTRSVEEYAPSEDMRKSIQNTIATIRKTPNSFDDWILLGIYRKQIGDYTGALEAWEFASKIRPEDAIPKNNIGMLYYLHTKEYAKAEEILLATTKTHPHYTATFQNLYELYHYAYKQGSGADEQILLAGIKENQKGIELIMLLASYYDEAGRNADAKKTYNEALVIAKEQGDEGLVAYIEELLSKL